MAVEKEDVRWGVAQRFEFIEWRAYWAGRVNRSDLEERFGVSTPQASVDLRTYQEADPANLRYDPAEKTYLPTAEFRPDFLRLTADRYLAQLNAILNHTIAPTDTWFGSLPSAAVMPAIVRSVEPLTLRSILRAIERRQEIDIHYQSLSSARWRTIAPHSLAFDGHRWHARAWCNERRQFRDFVLSRMLRVKSSRPSEVDPTNDVEWNTLVELKIVPHPALDAQQQLAISHDYGMKDGILSIPTRIALAYYLIRRLNLDLDGDQISPARQQIVLSNAVDVKDAEAAAKAESAARMRDALSNGGPNLI
jgi:predicted DNA-binding transcriptional regulator YafY